MPEPYREKQGKAPGLAAKIGIALMLLALLGILLFLTSPAWKWFFR